MNPSSSTSLAEILVARFLRSNNYIKTLDAFIREAGLPKDVGQANDKDTDWTIEGVLHEKKTFDQSVNFERYNEEKKDIWSEPAPSKPTIIQTPTSSNLLAASVEPWDQLDTTEDDEKKSYLVATGADRQLHLFRTDSGNDHVTSFAGHSDSPILSYASVRNGAYVFMTNMSGQLLLQHGTEVVDRRKDHTKYAVKVAVHEGADTGKVWVATAGWDYMVLVYCLNLPGQGEQVSIGEPIAHITLQSLPESLLFVRHADNGGLNLLVSRRDSTYIYYYGITDSQPDESSCTLLGKQNLAPHSNAWVAFSPSYLALSPHDPTLLAVATSSLPHMKVILVRLLFPTASSLDIDPGKPASVARDESVTQASQAMAALALQNREDAAILIQANTFAPQTAYSTPQVAWRPDGSGVWVNGDDGVIRGLEARSGKLVARLTGGHVVGSKVRTVWAGWVASSPSPGEREEWVVSGGFDKRLVVWKI